MGKIRIEELSVGDWVNIDDPLHSGAGQIVEIRSNIVLVQVPSCVVGARLGSIEPIPLTPEILEKNGFEKGEIYEGYSSIVFTNGNIRISWYKNAMWYRLRIYNALGDTELCSAIVRNVHQLQHALRLAGVGKEIVL